VAGSGSTYVSDHSLDDTGQYGGCLAHRQSAARKQLKKSCEDPGLEEYERKRLAVITANRNKDLYSQIFAVGAGISTFVGYLFWVGILQLPKRWSNSAGKRNFGAAGAMLELG
jgi:hypothetical protein